MLMIYVIAGVIGFIIYTLIKTKIEEWFEEPRYVISDRVSDNQ